MRDAPLHRSGHAPANYFQSGNSWNLKLAPVGVSATPVQAFAAL
ncbi:hypothetical protein [Acetobacter senegalensis]|nr:hypothetical protein [Acetobacter senegalensis]MDN7356014.1 hypothetical protein [Acetobacter senegalensis]